MIKSINVDQLKEKMDNGEELVIVDCREQEEWDQGHLPGAIFIPLSEFTHRFNELKEDAQIIMQCRSGRRSLTACQILLEHDYEDMANLEGGILDWEARGYEVVKD